MADASPSPGEMIGTLSDATRIFVPDDLTVMSTYVFLEQETWFEAEVPFIRRLARSGLRAIDIRTLTDAARSLGAGWAAVIWRVILPNLRTAVISASLITFAGIMSWCSFSHASNADSTRSGLFTLAFPVLGSVSIRAPMSFPQAI